MRARLLAPLAALAAVALLAPPAAAHEVGVAVDNPACDLVPGGHPVVCWDPYVAANPEAALECAVLGDPVTVCVTVLCTADLPPSRCGTGWFAVGFG